MAKSPGEWTYSAICIECIDKKMRLSKSRDFFLMRFLCILQIEKVDVGFMMKSHGV